MKTRIHVLLVSSCALSALAVISGAPSGGNGATSDYPTFVSGNSATGDSTFVQVRPLRGDDARSGAQGATGYDRLSDSTFVDGNDATSYDRLSDYPRFVSGNGATGDSTFVQVRPLSDSMFVEENGATRQDRLSDYPTFVSGNGATDSTAV